MSDDNGSKKDTLIMLGDNTAARISQDGTVALGSLSPVREGMPLNGGELVNVETCECGASGTIETVYKHSEEESRNGPAMVSTNAYRNGWDSVFGKDAN